MNFLKVISVTSLCFCVSTIYAQDKPETLAVKACETWLVHVDTEHYSDSWKLASQHLQNQITEEEWNSSLQMARKPLGMVIARKLKSTRYLKALPNGTPGTPDGDCVIIRYETTFKREQLSEIVTCVLEKGNAWKVAGYVLN